MNTNLKNYIRDTSSRLGGNSRTAWACLGVVPLRAGRRWVLPALIAVLNLIPAGRVTAQTFTTLHSFTAAPAPYYTNSNKDGVNPYAGLVTNASGATLYGTAYYGGNSTNGTVFAVNTDGTGFTTLHSFDGRDGDVPYAGLILSGNTLYGTAAGGGRSGYGAVFAVNTNGTGFTTLHSFTAVADSGHNYYT